MDIYTVAFAGHRCIDNFSSVEKKVEELVRELIDKHEYVDFLVGRDGDFDQIVSAAVRRVKNRYYDANCSLVWIMPYETSNYRNNVHYYEKYYDEIELCYNSSMAHFKKAILERNRYMVNRASLLICYVEKTGGAHQTMNYALKHGKEVVNIYELLK